LKRFEGQLLKTGAATHTLWSAIKDKAFYGLASQIGTYFGFNDVIQGLRGAYQYVAEIDKQMIELEKVSDMSTDRLAQSFDHATSAAKDLGSTVSDVIAATSDWSRLGYDADDAEI
jgi:phage-related tail protein